MSCSHDCMNGRTLLDQRLRIKPAIASWLPKSEPIEGQRKWNELRMVAMLRHSLMQLAR